MGYFEDLGSRPEIKLGYATRAVPLEAMVGVAQSPPAPRVGDLVLAEVVSVGKNTRIEARNGNSYHLFEGDRVVGVFGNRYATEQFEGYVPSGPVAECDMLSIGGLCGELTSSHLAVARPTRLRVLGSVTGHEGEPLNTRDFALSPLEDPAGRRAAVIVSVGSSMDSGKTHTAGTISRALVRAGHRVAAAKITGTAAGKDARFFESCGASPVFDFTHAGYPSTYMLGLDALLGVYRSLVSHMLSGDPDYVVLEIADGILQRETRMLLESGEFRSGVDHLFFSCGDSLSAGGGIRVLERYGITPRAISGALTQSELAIRETEEFTGFSCMSPEQMLSGDLAGFLWDSRREENAGFKGYAGERLSA